jgi:hypothetical protein
LTIHPSFDGARANRKSKSAWGDRLLGESHADAEADSSGWQTASPRLCAAKVEVVRKRSLASRWHPLKLLDLDDAREPRLLTGVIEQHKI